MTKNAIVVITYNRLVSLKRLINSLLDAEYLEDKIDLIVSMDCSGDQSLRSYIESIKWPFGDITKIFHKERLGLKKHVLFCGNLTEKYENLFVFEDDLYASNSFYVFGKQAIEFYKNDEDIAGISLYTYQWNQYVNKAFTPLSDDSDVFFMQVASSWGQIWQKERWRGFLTWMKNKTDEDLKKIDTLPNAVSNWSEHSWLKYHHAYLAETNKFFVYPRVSLSTNFSEPGQHAFLDSTYQVDIQHKFKNNYIFCKLENGVKYDSFYENMDIKINGYENLVIDLYGIKKEKGRYHLSTLNLPFKIERRYALRMRPHELNILNNIEGNQIFLFNMKVRGKNIRNIKSISYLYYYRLNNRKVLMGMWFYLIKSAIFRKFFKFIK